MAPTLDKDGQRKMAWVLTSMEKTNEEVAAWMGCSIQTVRRWRRRYQVTGQAKRYPVIRYSRTKLEIWQLHELLELLAYRNDLTFDEMNDFLFEQFSITLHKSNLSRQLKAVGWTSKKTHPIAAQRDEDLRRAWLYRIRRYSPQQLIFVDESGVDKRTGARRTGWAPKGLKAHRSTVLERGQRYQILPALALDGIVDVVIYPGTTNGDGFFAWISQGLLPKCAAFPAPKSVIVMDNASFHRRRDIKEACDAAGVILEFLPPYSPDFNPIEAFFGDLKRLFRQQYPIWNRDEADERDFKDLLADCVAEVGRGTRQIEGHFRHSFINFEGTERIFDDLIVAQDIEVYFGQGSVESASEATQLPLLK